MVVFKHKSQIELLGWLANLVLIVIILGKQSQEFPKNIGRLVNNYFMPKLLVTYGSRGVFFFVFDHIKHPSNYFQLTFNVSVKRMTLRGNALSLFTEKLDLHFHVVQFQNS